MSRASTARRATRARSVSEELRDEVAAAAPKPGRCTARTSAGSRCRRRAMPGANRCAQHIGPTPGRPTKLSAETTSRIIEILRQGGYVETAAAAAGVAKQTFYNWYNRGDPDATKKVDAPYRRFREEIDQALAIGEANNVAIVQGAAARGDWKAAAWLLERRHPDKFAGPRGRRLDLTVHPGDFADGEKSAADNVTDDQLGPDGRPL